MYSKFVKYLSIIKTLVITLQHKYIEMNVALNKANVT
jgi:hypothetical protein